MARLKITACWKWGVAGCLVTAAALLFFFNPEHYALYPRCLLYSITGFQCPGCGALRALHCLLHGRVAVAFHYNPLLVIGLPLLMLGWLILMGCKMAGRPLPNLLHRRVWLWVALGIFLAFGILRNLPFFPNG